jgi:hypothetical protein
VVGGVDVGRQHPVIRDAREDLPARDALVGTLLEVATGDAPGRAVDVVDAARCLLIDPARIGKQRLRCVDADDLGTEIGQASRVAAAAPAFLFCYQLMTLWITLRLPLGQA